MMLSSVLRFYRKMLSNFYLGVFCMGFDSVFDFSRFDGGFGCGVLAIGCFRKLVSLLGWFVLVYFGLKAVKRRFSGRFLNRFCFDGDFCRCGVEFLNVSAPPVVEKSEVVKETVSGRCGAAGFREDFGQDKQECRDEDQVFDVMSLRRLVKAERLRADDARSELEKERMASTTAAEEAMAMILRVQNEKSVLEMEAHQQRRLAHEKQRHDHDVIQSLRWIVVKHESERSLLEDKLRFCRRRSKIYTSYDDGEDGCERVDGPLNYLDDDIDDGLISSLDLGLLP